MRNTLKIATRKSKLALWQAQFVADQLKVYFPEIETMFVEITTEGDRQQTVALDHIGGKSVFVKALQEALLQNQADIAVHSMKDMSVHDTAGLCIGAVCKRHDPRDAFVSKKYDRIATLPPQAIVGTGSPRRSCLLKSLRPDVTIKLLRGNVDTRLLKCDRGEYDAIIVAAAGLERLQLTAHVREYLSPTIFTPAIAQGAIAVECRVADDALCEKLKKLEDNNTALCVTAERTVNRILQGDCHTAIGAYAVISDNALHLNAMVGDEQCGEILRASCMGQKDEAAAIGETVAQILLTQGAKKLL